LSALHLGSLLGAQGKLAAQGKATFQERGFSLPFTWCLHNK